MIVVETSVWIDHARGRDTRARAWLDAAIAGYQRVAVTDVILAELLAGARTERDYDRLLDVYGPLPILHADPSDPQRAASCSIAARRSGSGVRGIADCFIAATCIRERLVLAHADRDFDALASCTPLQVISLVSG